MPHLHLPHEHTDVDLALAGAIAEALNSKDLYVVWTHEGGANARPEIQAIMREPASSALGELVTMVVQALSDVWQALTRPAAPAPRQQPRSHRAPA